ncbi:hypothetical protein [Kumtagia ephedrae]|jgi:type II secretory pathway component PulK|uniref:General secretion pathway protein GspK n=1 Tax=Kumtagia ephedrae TaxID=2116701 RepID=A0A2P7SM46_9HYPH|nr:hypothetical protein [Mesorhizobium ephedrae]PSJ63455.1 hypothetical protein C7I84_07475 [Mesorhizobium ephedrae]
MSAPPGRPEHDNAGFALVAVLLFLLFVAAIVAPFAMAARTNWLVAANRAQQDRLDGLADAVLTLVAMRQLGTAGVATRQSLPLNSQPVVCKISGYLVTAELQDQTGLVDLNAADASTLATGLRALGVSEDQADDLAEAIVTYRSYEPQSETRGAEVEIFGGAKRGPFESVIELSDFQPLRDIPPAALYATFTVHSRLGIVVSSRAPKRLAIMMENAASPHADAGASRSPTAISVAVEAPKSPFRGHSAYLIEPSTRRDRPFRRIEKLLAARDETRDIQSQVTCPAPLSSDIAQVLAGLGP